MLRTNKTIAATFAVLLISGLAINPASAAVRDSYESTDQPVINLYKWSDIGYLTHGSVSPSTNALEIGQMEGFYKWSDLNFDSHASFEKNKLVDHIDNFYKWSDINSVTRN
jgi:hypothetical protein